jgi:hypothetical protein
MKIKTSKVASLLNIHPFHLFQHVAEISNSLAFDEVWPEIEDCWVETVSVASGHRKIEKNIEKNESRKIPNISEQNLSAAAIHLVDKLYRHSKWGNMSVSFEALVKLTHLSMHDIQNAVAELNKRKFLDHDGSGRGTISLHPARRKEIELIIQKQIKQEIK